MAQEEPGGQRAPAPMPTLRADLWLSSLSPAAPASAGLLVPADLPPVPSPGLPVAVWRKGRRRMEGPPGSPPLGLRTTGRLLAVAHGGLAGRMVRALLPVATLGRQLLGIAAALQHTSCAEVRSPAPRAAAERVNMQHRQLVARLITCGGTKEPGRGGGGTGNAGDGGGPRHACAGPCRLSWRRARMLSLRRARAPASSRSAHLLNRACGRVRPAKLGPHAARGLVAGSGGSTDDVKQAVQRLCGRGGGVCGFLGVRGGGSASPSA